MAEGDTHEAKNQRNYAILVYGLESKSLPLPSESLRTSNFTIFFEPLNTHRRFQEYDGVVFFQGSFESFQWQRGWDKKYVKHSCNRDDLDKRSKETRLLLDKGGFICCILTDAFLDSNDGNSFKTTDLSKQLLNYSDFYRKNFRERVTGITSVANEFKRFFDIYGAANSYFENHNQGLDLEVLARFDSATVGMLLEQVEYFVPALLPAAREKEVEEFFMLLVDGLTSLHNKMQVTIPSWAAAYKFSEENELVSEREKLLKSLAEIDTRAALMDRYKSVLVLSGEKLVAEVAVVLAAALSVSVDSSDESREDLKILVEGKIVGIGEVKGINRGIGRANINQTDSHRERSGYKSDFPAFLIANTNIKNSNSLADKDQEIDPEQIKHAVQMRVLLLRTLDLLGLLKLVLEGNLNSSDARAMVLNNTGWLRVRDGKIQVLDGR